MKARDLLGLLGVALGVIGIAGVAVPGLFAGLSVSRTAISLVGGGLLLLSVRTISDRRENPPTGAGLDGASADDPETAPDLPTPGDEFDREVADITDRPRHGRARERIRERLRETAIAALQRQRDCSREEAATLLDRGEWTDDPVAAATFSGHGIDESFRNTVRRYVRGQSRFEYRARRTALAIERLTEGDG